MMFESQVMNGLSYNNIAHVEIESNINLNKFSLS